jgi:hypothetical protein
LRARSRIDPSTIDGAAARTLWEAIERAGLDVALWDATSDTGVATFHCLIADRSGPQGHIGLGSGAHPDRAEALARALSEAAQTRLNYITGARDDLSFEEFLPKGTPGQGEGGRSPAGARTAGARFHIGAVANRRDLPRRPRLAAAAAGGGRGERGGGGRSEPEGCRSSRWCGWSFPASKRPMTTSDMCRVRAPWPRGRLVKRRRLRRPVALRAKLDVRPEIVLRPPAAQGDIYRACLLRPRAIGLIDGYFEGVPSVWHKEVLWALSQGIAVYGSASMGALRAAELDVFGMTGIGAIYDWYRSGVIEDDDEVALLHGPAEAGYVPLSEPSVNVRASCAAAVEAGVIDQAAAETVIGAARSLHYKERQWRAILDQPAHRARSGPVQGLADWLAEGRVDQKQRDALALIEAVADALDRPGSASPPASASNGPICGTR